MNIIEKISMETGKKLEKIKKIHPNIDSMFLNTKNNKKNTKKDKTFITLISGYKHENKKNKKETKNYKFKMEGTFVGYFNIENKTWYWAWAIDGINKKVQSYIKKNCDKIVANINENYSKLSNVEDHDLLKFYFSNPIFKTQVESLENIVPMITGISDAEWFISFQDDSLVSVYLITNIKQVNN